MITRYNGKLSSDDINALLALVKDKKIVGAKYDFQDGFSYVEFRLEDDTKLTVYYPLEEGGVTVTEGFP
ncbi:MAG: hypothetical protein M1357_00790 [Candidatus Marsarchaeota archaeon]|nr:hypothetical protein [Candidatus Marsarchaeota archaeon]